MQSALTVDALTPAIGAEIHRIDLAAPSREDIEAVKDALHKHLVVFFRNQSINDRQQRDFARHFGPVKTSEYNPGVDPEVPEIHIIASGGPGEKQTDADRWHADATFLERPPMGTVLRAVTLPSRGGDTLWANMYAAYDALSSHMQSLLSDIIGIHGFPKPAPIVAKRDPVPLMEHPVVRTHPVTGRKALYVNSIFTVRLKGLTERENAVLLPFLQDHVRSPDFQCRFRWREGSIAFWDNRCTQHYATYDYTERRVMHRVVIDGERPR